MKLAGVLSVALFFTSMLAQAPQSYRTVHSIASNGANVQSRFFDAKEGNRLQVSISCNFVDNTCLAGSPYYWDGVHNTYYRLREMLSLRQMNLIAGTQQQFFVITLGPLTRKQIQVVAPGEKLFADYTLLVQEDTSIETK
jgi:hypothetical protein